MDSVIGLTHFVASRMDNRWKLVAGCFSRDADMNHKTGQEWGISRIYHQWQELIIKEKERVDAVALLTPTPDHAPILHALLEADIPVICEKAVVSDLEQLAQIEALYDPSRHFLAVTFNYSGYPMVRELRALIESGELGNIQQHHLEMPQETFIRRTGFDGKPVSPQRWRLRDGPIPTLCLDLGVHLHHLSTFCTDQHPVAVSACMDQFSGFGVIDNVMLYIRFNTGAVGSYWFGKTALGYRNGLRMRFFGDLGAAEWYQMECEQLRLSFQDGSHRLLDHGSITEVCQEQRYHRMKPGHPSGFIEAFANLYADLADALVHWNRTGRFDHPFVYGLEHAAEGLHLFDAAVQSWKKNGQWVETR